MGIRATVGCGDCVVRFAKQEMGHCVGSPGDAPLRESVAGIVLPMRTMLAQDSVLAAEGRFRRVVLPGASSCGAAGRALVATRTWTLGGVLEKRTVQEEMHAMSLVCWGVTNGPKNNAFSVHCQVWSPGLEADSGRCRFLEPWAGADAARGGFSVRRGRRLWTCLTAGEVSVRYAWVSKVVG